MKKTVFNFLKIATSLVLCCQIITFTKINPLNEVNAKAPTMHSELNETIQQQLNDMTAQMVSTIPNNDNTVQVFDVKQGHVVKSIENNAKIQKQTSRLLKGITEFAPEVQPDMKAKYIVRVPIQAGTAITVNNQNITIQQLFIFYYVNKDPLILVFDENKHPFLFHTSYSINPLLKLIQLD